MKYQALLVFIISLPVCPSYHERVTTLLDQVYHAQAYWKKEKEQNAWYNPANWLAKRPEGEVVRYQEELTQEEHQLISLLATAPSPTQDIPQTVMALQAQHNCSPIKYGTQGHFKKYWVSYALGITATALTAAYLYSFFKNNTLFIVDPKTPSIAQALEAGPFLAGKNFVQKNGTQYLQVPKSQEAGAKEFLEANQCTYTQTTPQLSLSFYNEQGETKVGEFIRLHGTEPVKNISKIIKNESPSELALLKSDPKVTKDTLEKRFDQLITRATTEERTRLLVENQLKTRTVAQLSFEEKSSLADALCAELSAVGPEHLQHFLTSISDAQKVVAKTTIPQTLEKISLDFKKLPHLQPLSHPCMPDNIPALPPFDTSPLTKLPPIQIPSFGGAQPSSGTTDAPLDLHWLAQRYLPNAQIVNTNVGTLTQQSKNLVSSVKNLLEIFETTAHQLQQPQPIPSSALPNLQPTQPPYTGIPLLSAARDLDNVLIRADTAIVDFSNLLHNVEAQLLPEATKTTVQAGTLAASANALTEKINATTIPAINTLTKEAAITVHTINTTSLPEINGILSAARSAVPKMIDDVNALSAKAQQIADQVQQGTVKANDMIDVINNDFLPPLHKIVSDSQAISQTVNTTLEAAKKMGKENTGLWSLCTEALLVRATQRDLQLSTALNEAARLHEKLKLTTELASMVPLVLTTAAAYKGTTTAYKKIILDPAFATIKKDLIAFQLLCNQETDTGTVSERYKGLSCYWITRLKRSITKVPHALQDSYKNYVESLERSDQSPAQKMRIIDVMFKEYSPLSR